METFNYTLVPQLIGATNYTGTNLSISGNISAANANISGTLTIAGTLNTNLSETITNLIQINISASSTNITNATVVSMVVTSNLIATNNSNTLGNLFMTGGNVGIGTYSPITKLNIQGDVSASNASDSGQFIISGQTNPLKRLGFMIDTNNNVGIIQAGLSGTSTYNIGLNSATYSAYTYNYPQWIGNVGIGTTSPGYLLDVNGNARINNNLMFNTAVNNNLGINFPNTGYGLHWGNGYSRIYDDGDLRICTDDYMHFYTGSTTTSPGTERITILPSGNVGIGTSSPQYMLDINGSLRVNDTSVNMYNKLLVLWDNNSGDSLTSATNFSGFGINSNTLRYQVPSGNTHEFYCGTVGSLQIVNSGRTQVIIPAFDGSYYSDWPIWDGGIATWDICAASVTFEYGFNQRSDIRKKQDIVSITRGLNEIKQMRPVSFKWKNNLEYGTQFGFIAQEMEKIVPEIINEDSDGFKSISNAYSPIIANAIKELKQKLDIARDKIDKLRSQKVG